MQKEHFDITGMTCSTRVEQCVAKLPGVTDVSVNLLKNSMAVSYDEGVLNTASIVAAVENAMTFAFIQFLLLLPVLAVNSKYFKVGFRTLGKTLEARAKGKTSDAITKLMNLAPKTATVEREG